MFHLFERRKRISIVKDEILNSIAGIAERQLK
jgi:hypothetical protein